MTRAEELVKRIVKEFEYRGYEIIEKHAIEHSTGEDVIYRYDIVRDDKEREIRIEETYRHNGTKENVTAKIKVLKPNDNQPYFKDTILEIKIPYEATKRVINNRINKALEKFIYSDPEPFNMKMLDSFYQ